jgi:hypothetical protein
MSLGRLVTASLVVLALGACETEPATLEELHQTLDWDMDDGRQLNDTYASGVRRILGSLSRPDEIDLLKAAGYECIFGEGHELYPDPAAQCTRSFATRECQFDWEVFTTVGDDRKLDDVEASFRRDCVGTDRDWPDAVNSPIDDQLAPPPPDLQ